MQEIRPPHKLARELIRHLLEMDAHGLKGTSTRGPARSARRTYPALSDWLVDAEYSRPGCLITWYENDAINACFDEEAQHMGENGPCQPNVALPIHWINRTKKLDEEVRRVFDHAGAMLRSLASAAKVVELVRDLYDEYLREHRLESGLPAEPGAAGVRERVAMRAIPYRHPFVTLHEVMHDGDVARLAEGQLMTPQMLIDLMAGLGRSVPAEILPARVLGAHGGNDCLVEPGRRTNHVLQRPRRRSCLEEA